MRANCFSIVRNIQITNIRVYTKSENHNNIGKKL